MNADVVVIGGGFAGISAALSLADQGVSVLLLEKKRVLGGRAFSYQDPQTFETVDNGQHLLMGCYHHTLELLEKLGTEEKLYRQPSLQVSFLDANHQWRQLSCPANKGFLGLLIAFLKIDFLSFSDKLKAAITLPFYFSKMKRADTTVQQWLKQAKQPRSLQKLFWEPLCYAALNESPERASSSLLHKVLEEAFLKRKGVDGLIFPKTGLTELMGEAAQRYLNERNGEIRTSCSVKKINVDQRKISSIELITNETLQPKAVISTLPPSSLKKIVSEFSYLSSCQSSPILSIHLWLKTPLASQPFFALLDSPLHWVFNRQKIWEIPEKAPYLYSLIVSGAHDWVLEPNEKIEQMVRQELTRFFPHFDATQIERIKIIKELEATLTPSAEMLRYRPKSKTSLENFFLAGDWTDTGLPATIESAVLSGKLAAAEVLKTLHKGKHHERTQHRV